MNTIPRPADRSRDADLKVLARKLVSDRLSFDDSVNWRLAEGGDMLTDYVSQALGAKYHVSWSTLPEAEVADICALAKTWGDYCCELFNDVEAFVLDRLG